MTSTTVSYRGYTVTSFIVERTIFLKFVDQVGCIQYEANVEPKDLRLQHNLPIIYKIMMDTFADNDDNFKLDITIANGFMKLAFHALFGGYLDIHFELELKEKIITGDDQLSMILEDRKMVKLLNKLSRDEGDKVEEDDEDKEIPPTCEETDPKKRSCLDPNRKLNHRLPGPQTMLYAGRVAVNMHIPIVLDYWVPSLEKKAFIGQNRDNGEKLLVLSEREYTKPILQIYKGSFCSSEYIVLTEKAVYIVASDILFRWISC